MLKIKPSKSRYPQSSNPAMEGLNETRYLNHKIQRKLIKDSFVRRTTEIVQKTIFDSQSCWGEIQIPVILLDVHIYYVGYSKGSN